MISKFSKKGSYHKENNVENQDVICSGENERFAVITLADGVSTCKKARKGAEIVSKVVTDLFLSNGQYFMKFSKRQTANMVIEHILNQLRKMSESEKTPIEEYSSTIACVLLDKKKKKILTFSLGDSIILSANSKECDILEMPMYDPLGCSVTTSDNAKQVVNTKVIDVADTKSVIICSDGMWDKMFYRSRIKDEVKMILTNGMYDELKMYIDSQDCFDDSSFIAMNLKN